MPFWLPPAETSPRRLITTDRVGRAVDYTASPGTPVIPYDAIQEAAVRAEDNNLLEERAGVPWYINEISNPIVASITGWAGYAGPSNTVTTTAVTDGPAGTGITTAANTVHTATTTASTGDLSASTGTASADVSVPSRQTIPAYCGLWMKFVYTDEATPRFGMALRMNNISNGYVTNSPQSPNYVVTVGDWVFVAYYTTVPTNATAVWASPMGALASSMSIGQTRTLRATGAVVILNPPTGLPTGPRTTVDHAVQCSPSVLNNAQWEGAVGTSRTIFLR